MTHEAEKIVDVSRESKVIPRLGWFHRYPARFSTEVLAQMFAGVQKELGRAPQMILDPFAGTGATLSYARRIGANSMGVELTPLGVLIAKVRLAPPTNLAHALAFAERLVKDTPRQRKHHFDNELVSWIGEKNACILDYYLERLQDVTDRKLQRWLKLAISSSLRPCSTWLAGSIKPQVDPSRGFSHIGVHFMRAARTLKRDCALETAVNATNAVSRIVKGDARRLPLEDESVDAVITSPPYWTMYDYFDVHRLTYLSFRWIPQARAQIGRNSHIESDGVGFVPPHSMMWWYREAFRKENTIAGRALRDYFVSIRTHLAELSRVVKPGGVIAYNVANSFRSNRRFKLARAFVHLMREHGFKDIITTQRENSHKRILPAGRDARTGRFSRRASNVGVEEVLIFAKR